MTLATGETIRIHESWDPLDEVEVNGAEIMDVLSDDVQAEIVEAFNAVRDDWHEEAVESVAELPDHVHDDWEDWVEPRSSLPRLEILSRVLEAREDVYVWTTVHSQTIVTNLGKPPVEPEQMER
ncbi:hypothetical protein ACFQDD_11255 [Halorubrum pallidum]|uniref:Uncharacterized protein n=1 Tax=Halorubrum pallidum TaxID=1526114 RepID=A0ABD5T9C2_9EURY